eukprot:541722_1
MASLRMGRPSGLMPFCTSTKDQASVFDYKTGDVTVIILNVQNNKANVDFNIKGDMDEYLLTSYPKVINSRDIFVNGKLLKMVNDKTFPTIQPKRVESGSSIEMEPYSYGFYVFVNFSANACT